MLLPPDPFFLTASAKMYSSTRLIFVPLFLSLIFFKKELSGSNYVVATARLSSPPLLISCLPPYLPLLQIAQRRGGGKKEALLCLGLLATTGALFPSPTPQQAAKKQLFRNSMYAPSSARKQLLLSLAHSVLAFASSLLFPTLLFHEESKGREISHRLTPAFFSSQRGFCLSSYCGFC